MAEKKKMSVAEILAAARRADGKGGAPEAAPAQSPEPAAEEPAGHEESAAPAAAEPVESASEPVASEKPAAPPAAKPKPAAGGARPSVADILKAAREGKAAGASPAPPPAAPKAEVKPAEPKAAPKPPAAKPAAAAKPAPKAPAGKADGAATKAATAGKDTASILAAARKQNKAGPMTKSEAAAKLKPEPEAKPKSTKPAVPPMPAKPAAAKPKAKEAVAEEDRRGFLAFAVGSFLGVGFTSLAATGGLWTLGFARFMFPNVLIEPPSKFKVGFPGDFAPGMVEEKFKAQFGVWVVKAEYQGQMQIYALRTVCTHLGCTPNWLEGEQKFKCPCHGSGFYKDGINFEGPAPRPLERYAIHMADDGQLEIDKSKTFQEEMGQWKDASCFVPV